MNIIFRFRTSKNISRNKIYPKKGLGPQLMFYPVSFKQTKRSKNEIAVSTLINIIHASTRMANK